VTAAQFNIDSVLVVSEATNARERRVDQAVAVVQSSLLFGCGQRARIGQEAYVVDHVVARARNVNIGGFLQSAASHVAVEAQVSIAFFVLADEVWLGHVLDTIGDDKRVVGSVAELFELHD